MWGRDGRVQPHWQPFVQALQQLGPEEIARSEQEVNRQLRENGVTYNVHGDPYGLQRPWALDLIPLIISQEDWAIIEAGMIQRATLLNLILTDIYGRRELIKKGLLPLELIYSHSGFLRTCDNNHLPGPHQLIIYAADLARGPDQRMWVLSDRTQAPSGAGYALENRVVTARVLRSMFKDGQICRLSNFFRELQAALTNLAPPKESPRIVVLTPGPHNETYFEHAYLASYLGYSLAQGDDLTVRDGMVALKSLGGLQRVDVIVRRVDDLFCDPLELRIDSRLGVAGLLEASRRQSVAIANPLGSSVLENPGLMPFMAGLAKYFLGEDLILPSAATWWCGQQIERDYVLHNIENLIIKKIFRQTHSRTVLGTQLSRAEREALREEIKRHPYLYVGQEQVSFSTSPSLVNGQFEARHAVLRSFAVARHDSYVVMPGGLTRSAPERGYFIVSNQAGGISKDTWVLTSKPQRHVSLWLQADRVKDALRNSHFLASRAAENLFWVGRYAERAEATARLLRTILLYYNENNENGDEGFSDEVEAEALSYLLQALTQVTMTYPGFVGAEVAARLASPASELRSVILDADRAGSLIFNLNAMAQAAYAVRDLWSTDTWRVIDGLESSWSHLYHHDPEVTLSQIQPELNRLITTLMAFAGLNMESMTHEAGWLLLDIGRRLERAGLTIALLRSTLDFQHNPSVHHLLLESVLKITENVITYRRRYHSYLQLQTVLDLLLFDKTNPRSLAYQLNTLQAHLARLPRDATPYRLSKEEQLILEAHTRLHLSDSAVLVHTINSNGLRENFEELMARLAALLNGISEVIIQTYFIHAQSPHQLVTLRPGLAPGLSDET
jgi:uncharacterized circularly permuted ATP-grasp superfamily protein/uncharacterized alpha-E superfamily protein